MHTPLALWRSRLARLALASALVLALVVSWASPAEALDLKLPDSSASLRVGVTQSLTAEYHSDFDPIAGNPADKYFDFKNRSQILVMHGTTSFSLRMDGSWFIGLEDQPAGQEKRSTTTVEKVTLSSIQRNFDATAGDFYIRVGRGIALDLTKVDELTRDTTVRGGRLELRFGAVRGLVFGGWINPVDVDDATEQRRKVPSDLVGGGVLEIRAHRNLRFGAHYVGLGMQDAQGGRKATHVLGATVEAPAIADRLTLYAEVDYLNAVEGVSVGEGFATYFSGVLNLGPLAFMFEFRFYDNFEIRNNFGGERDTYIYARSPTATRPKQQILNAKSVMGPRLRVDLRLGKTILFASINYFYRSDATPDQDFFSAGLWVLDGFGGLQAPILGGNMELQGGYRYDTGKRPTGEEFTDYSQLFFEGEISVPVARGHNVEMQFEYRKLVKPGDHRFWDFSIGASWRPSRFFAIGFTYEYSTEFTVIEATDGTPRTHFGSGQATVNFTPTSYARLFVGSTRGGLLCLDGFCRTVPPFIGARTELVFQF